MGIAATAATKTPVADMLPMSVIHSRPSVVVRPGREHAHPGHQTVAASVKALDLLEPVLLVSMKSTPKKFASRTAATMASTKTEMVSALHRLRLPAHKCKDP